MDDLVVHSTTIYEARTPITGVTVAVWAECSCGWQSRREDVDPEAVVIGEATQAAIDRHYRTTTQKEA